MYKGRGLLGNAITRWWTGSHYSHCELVIDDICYSASFMDGGVRKKNIDLKSGRWDIVSIDWADKQAAIEFFENTKGAKYDWIGILGSQLINRKVHDINRWFCSEWVGCAIKFPNPEMLSPDILCKWVKFLNIVVK